MYIMLIGTYEHTIDVKGRLNMPSKMREALGETFYMTTGLGKFLFVFPRESFSEYYEKLSNIPFNDLVTGDFARNFLSNATECIFDKQGRFIVPQTLRNHANLQKDVRIMGVGKRIEIWGSENWEEHVSQNKLSIQEMADHMAKLNI